MGSSDDALVEASAGPPEPPAEGGGITTTALLVVVGIALLGGFMLKGHCLGGFDGRQYGHLCYNDIQPLYDSRQIGARIFPYVHGHLEGGQLIGGAIEYPVLTGLFMWASGTFAADANEYLIVTAVLLAPFGFYVAYLLGRMAGRRALMWAAAPAVVLYAFHNWDLLVVAAAVAGLWSWHLGRREWAGVWFGVGAALKMYPLFFLAPLGLERWTAGDRAGAVRAVGAGAGTFLLINLPFILANFDGWWATFEFHRARFANFDTIWQLGLPEFGIATPSVESLNLLTAALTAGSFLAILAFGWLRALREGRFPFLQVCAAMLAAFLLWNKVHSPQYTLWLLPFFVLVRINVGWWVSYTLADLAVYVGIFRWFYDTAYLGIDPAAPTFTRQLLIGGIWARFVLLVALIVVFLKARAAPGAEGVAEVPATIPSHPPANLERVEAEVAVTR